MVISYGRASQTISNNPYCDWSNLDILSSKEYGSASTCSVTSSNLVPAPLVFNEFSFSIAPDKVLDKITVFYALNVSDECIHLLEPNVVLESDSFRTSINGDTIISTEYIERSVTFDSSTGVPDNIDISNLNNQDLTISLEFNRNDTNYNLGEVYLQYLYVEVEYSDSIGCELHNTEVNEYFPDSTNPKIVEVYDTFTYTLKFKDPTGTGWFRYIPTQTNVRYKVNVDLPDGLEVVGYTGNGTYDYENNVWTPTINNTEPVTIELIIKTNTTGTKLLRAYTNVYMNSNNRANETYDYYVKVINSKGLATVTGTNCVISFPELYACRIGQKIRILLQGVKNTTFSFSFGNLPRKTNSTVTYKRKSIDFNLRDATVINSNNIDKLSFTNVNVVITTQNNFEPFNLELELPVYINGVPDNQPYITIRAGISERFDYTVQPNQPLTGIMSTDKYYWDNDTYHILKENDGTVTVDNTQFIIQGKCDEKYYMRDCDLGILFEPIKGYIGPIKLNRSHANAKNDTTNTLIKEQYQNRVNYGKKGDYSESRTSTIRLPPKDIKLLQGLTQLDKPVPIDTAPLLPDGDPLTLRGWAELYGVKGISKINANLYECTPVLDFLTYDVNTRFNVTRGEPIADYTLPRVFENTITGIDRLDEYFDISGNGLYTNDIIKRDSINNEYEYENKITLKEGETLTFTSHNLISNISNITFEWLNDLFTPVDKPYPNWSLAIKLLDSKNNNLIFQYMYYNFIHAQDGTVVNKSSSQAVNRYNNNYTVKTWSDLYLEWGNNETAIEESGLQFKTELRNYTIDSNTGLPYYEDNEQDIPAIIEFTEFGRFLQMRLVADINGVTTLNLSGKTIGFTLSRVKNGKISTETGDVKTYYVNTSNSGIASLKCNLSNGDYHCRAFFIGDETYLESNDVSFYFTVNALRTETKITGEHHDGKSYTENGVTYTNPVFTSTGEKIRARLLTSNGQAISNEYVQFVLYKTTDKEFKTPSPTYTVKTDNQGYANLEINLATGEYVARVTYSGSGVYQPCTPKLINVTVQLPSDTVITKITGQDAYFTQLENKHIVSLTDINGKPLSNKTIRFDLINSEDQSVHKVYTRITDTNGMAYIPITLSDWTNAIIYVIASFEGTSRELTYNGKGLAPSTTTNTVILDRDGKRNTSIVPNFEEGTIFTDTRPIFDGLVYEYIDANTRTPLTDTDVSMTFFKQSTYDYHRKSMSVQQILADTTITRAGPYNEPVDNNGRWSYGMRNGKDNEGISLSSNGDYVAIITYDGDIIRNNSYHVIRFSIQRTNVSDGTVIDRPKGTIQFLNTNAVTGSTRYYNKGTDTLPVTVRLLDNNGVAVSDAQLVFDFIPADSNFNKTGITSAVTYPNPNNPIPSLTDSNGDTVFEIRYESNLTNPDKYYIMVVTYISDSLVATNEIPLHINSVDTSGTTPVVVDNRLGTSILCDAPSTISSKQDIHFTIYGDDGKGGTVLLTNSTGLKVWFVDNNNPSRNNQNTPYELETDSYGVATLPFELSNSEYTIYATYTPPNTLNNYKESTYSKVITSTIYSSIKKTPSIILHKNNKKGSEVTSGVINVERTNGIIKEAPTLYMEFTDPDTGEAIGMREGVAWVYSFENTSKYYVYGAKSKEYTNQALIYSEIDGTEIIDETGYASKKFEMNQSQDVICTIIYGGSDKYLPTSKTVKMHYVDSTNNSLIENTITNILDANGNPIKLFNNRELSELNFGSTLEMEIQDTSLHLKDYGLTSEYGITAPKVDYECSIDPATYYLQIEIKNLQSTESTINIPDVKSQFWVEILGDTENSKYLPILRNLIISPMPLPSRSCQYIRRVEDGILHYYDYNPYGDVDYLGDPHNQYEGGCDLQTSGGYSVVDTESGYNPLVISNGLVKASFDRMSKYIRLYRYNPNTTSYIEVQALKVNEIPDMRLEHYSDDKIIVTFGLTRWTIWRGHPFLQCEHNNTELKILGDYNRIWCEKSLNDHLGNPVEQDTRNGYFNTYYSPNLFPYKLYLNDDLKLDNFKLTSGSNKSSITKITRRDDSSSKVQVEIGANTTDTKLQFPYPAVIEKPEGDSFSLYVGEVVNEKQQTITVTLNCYDKSNQIVKTVDKTVTLSDEYNGSINLNYRLNEDVNNKTSYINFTISFNNTNNTPNSITFSKFMLYDKYVPNPVYTTNNPSKYYDTTKVYFENNYYAKLYNKQNNYGLCVIKPGQDFIYLNRIPASNRTVFAPYLKNSQIFDRPEMVALEYMTFHEQTQTINRVE